MGIRFRKSITICKGVKVNFGKTGTSLSFGTKGLRKTIHSSGRVTSSVGIPGTGLYYTTSSGGKRKGTSGKQRAANSYAQSQRNIQAQREKENELMKNQQMVRSYEERIENIKSIHQNCDEYIDWNHINHIPAPFDPMQIGPLEVEAQRKIDEFAERFYERWIPSLGQRRKQKAIAEAEVARQMDSQNYGEWENLNELSSRILAGDEESYLYVVAEMHPFDDILEFGSDFEVGVADSDVLEVEFHVKSDEVVPKQVLSLTKTGKLSSKDMTKTLHYDIMQDYICSSVIRIARDMFALLPVTRVIIHAVDTVLNTANGYYEEATILSVAFNKEAFASINFNMIDPSDMIESFEHNMDFKKTQGLKPVGRIES